MIDLMRLELKKCRIRTYLCAIGLITLGALSFLYTFAMIACFGGEADTIEFSSYENIWVLMTALYTAAYAILIAVMASEFVIKDFSGKSAQLLFTCPVDKKRLLNAKIFLISIVGIGGMAAGFVVVFVIFYISELIFPLVPDSFTVETIIKIWCVSILCSVYSLFIGIISSRIGFIKKSVQTTIVSAVLLSSGSANLIAIITKSPVPFLLIWLIAAISAVLAYRGILLKVQVMEV